MIHGKNLSSIKWLLFLLILVFICINPNTTLAISSYSATQVWEKITTQEDLLIIDVRNPEAYIEKHIPTAINIPSTDIDNASIANYIESYGKSEIITYCSCTDGYSAQQFAISANNLGIMNINYMHDDFRYWPYDTQTGEEPGTVQNNTAREREGNNALELFFYIDIILGVLIVIGIYFKKK